MAKKQMLFKTKGMNRDLSVSAFNPEFAFENMNLRLATNEGNTTLSWVNEMGTAQIDNENQEPLRLIGIPIGTAIIDHKLVVFTTTNMGEEKVTSGNHDYIYVVRYTDSDKTIMEYVSSFEGGWIYNGNLNFSTKNPLETLVSYEAENIQKVYWTDGRNQPRVINIMKEYDATVSSNYCFFDAVRELKLEETIKVEKQLSASGMFAPGVIQYAFTYYDKYGQESNIFYTSPLQYISYKDRGASPEDKVENAFKISITNPDTRFEYLRIYSIQRTSINGTPIVKRIQDISLEGYTQNPEPTSESYANNATLPQVYGDGNLLNITTDRQFQDIINVLGTNVLCYGFKKGSYNTFKIAVSDYDVTFGPDSTGDSVIWITGTKITYEGVYAYYIIETVSPGTGSARENLYVSEKVYPISYIDTGISGDSMDPTELLYKGGDIIAAETIEQKDNTLFMGGISLKRPSIVSIRDSISLTIDDSTRTFEPVSVSDGYYRYSNQLTSKGITSRHSGMTVPCGGFKTGEKYRLGVQFQHKSGKWSDPIFIEDKIAKSKFSSTSNQVTVPVFSGYLTGGASELIAAEYKRMRPVVVFPNMIDRNIICQGVVAPTVYKSDDRTNESCFAQSSWFFRPLVELQADAAGDSDDDREGKNLTTMCPKSAGGVLRYTSRQINSSFPEAKAVFNPKWIRQVEIEGEYDPSNKFNIDRDYRTLHSPDIEFDDQVSLLDFTGASFKQRGTADFSYTMSDIDIQTETPTVSSNGAGFVHKSFSSLGAQGIVSGLFYDDYMVDDDLDGGRVGAYPNQRQSCKWLIYPWQGSGYLNNDMNRPTDKGIGSSKLKKKVISNLRYASTSLNDFSEDTEYAFAITPQIFNSEEVSILKFDNHIYKGNIDTMLTPDAPDGNYFCFNGWIDEDIKTPFNSTVWCKMFNKEPNSQDQNGFRKWNGTTEWKWGGDHIGNKFVDLVLRKYQVRMKYKSTPHLFSKFHNLDEGNGQLAIVEINQVVNDATRFGGTSEDALRENVWIPCGEPVAIHNGASLYWDYGDTYFQRYDCLKTYPFTKEDINQVVEIGSFMLETRVNIDGRYDRNRGQQNNLNMSPQNFNLINQVYSQIDNFFTYRIMPDDYYKTFEFPNQITWSKTKENGADVDTWTNITLASILEMDGNKGKITAIKRFNDRLICFQDSGISQILYNENTQITTSEGVPIEIANSGKVQGKRYINDTIGCSNKWSICQTPSGIYFMDSNEKSIYKLGDGIQNVSLQGGMNSWCKKNIPANTYKWNPNDFENFITYYDRNNQDILFVNSEVALAFSEKFNTFTSFYNYGGGTAFVNLDGTGIWITRDLVYQGCYLWKHNGGSRCVFFGEKKPYWMTLVGNPEPQADKIFTNLEFRTTQTMRDPGDIGLVPFNYLETWNDYQHGLAEIDIRSGHNAMVHHRTDSNDASLKRKFRIWRCDIPRDNAPLNFVEDLKMGISRTGRHPMDRMRNNWLYIKLYHAEAGYRDTLRRTEIHDVVMTYYD